MFFPELMSPGEDEKVRSTMEGNLSCIYGAGGEDV